MNATVEPTTPVSKRCTSPRPPAVVSKRCTSPRPPAVGEEVKRFHDTSHNSLELNKDWNMEYQSKPSFEEYGDKSAIPACSENIGESIECIENSSNSSPPAPYKWAQSLVYLLEDIQGVSLFQQFLKQEGQDSRCLSFWFACRGVKKHNPNDRDGLVKLIHVVFEKKVKRISAISAETKEEIRQKLLSKDVDDTIFDAAQREVEAYMMKTTYPNFLRSDLYIQHVGGFQDEFSSEKECTVSPQPVDVLPTLHEDSELQIPCNKFPLTKTNLLLRSRISPESKLKPEGPAGYLQSPYNYHSKYGSLLHSSAQNSELQSLSSDAQTDDTMSLTDGSVDYTMHTNRNKKRSQQKVSKQNIIKDDKLSLGTFIPRTQRLPESTQPKSQEEFHSILTKRLEKVLEEQKMKDKIYERLKRLESSECSKPDVVYKVTDKSNAAARFEPNFLCAPSEENVQDILDQHISRVFEDSGQHTPASECLSPPVARPTSKAFERYRVPPPGISCEHLPDVPSGALHKQGLPQFNAPSTNIKQRRDHDTHSADAMFNFVSDDGMPTNYRCQYSSVANSEPVDCSQRSREHSKRNVSKKFSSMADSNMSFGDSGIICEPVLTYNKMTWLEAKRHSDQEREQQQHMLRNSSTSPVLSRSSRKAVVSNCSRSGAREAGCSQWSAGTSTQITAQESSVQSVPPSNTTSSLLEARKRLEDENRAKLRLKNISGSRNSHDSPRMKFPKAGYDSFDDSACHRKLRKSYPTPLETPVSSTPNDVTVIGYSYGRHSVPYLSKIPGKNITLRHFKSLLSKKGNFRFFFKTASDDFGTGVVFEEVTDDCKVLPMWEGKVFCVIESMDDNSGS